MHTYTYTGAHLSIAAESVWAKTGKASEGTAGQWMPLYQHMRDSGAVAGKLWDEWLPASTRALLGADSVGSAVARKRMVFLAAAHDLGKATPAFAQQSLRDFERMLSAGLSRPKAASSKSDLWHSEASMFILERWLQEGPLALTERVASSWAVVPGSHHGRTPEDDYYKRASATHLIGDRSWVAAQDELAGLAFDISGLTEDDMAAATSQPLTKPQQVIATAVVILADWLASDTDRFPLDGHGLDRTSQALATIGFPPHWAPSFSAEPADDFYGSRFRFGSTPMTPRPSQVAALDVARAVAKPGLMIVEAPMGEGKTEIGLAVAEVFASRTGAGGVFFALPTMSTADAIFNKRFKSWVQDRARVTGDRVSLYLAHSRASMNDEFTALPVQGKLSQICDEGGDESSAVAHEWLSGGKKGVLASFVVGTIDQILIAALRSHHVMLRHLALANKVVIIDEVHAADTYMSVYLDMALEWLGEYSIPVVLLSATLPAARRAELLSAYSPNADVAGAAAATGYPIVTATDGDTVLVRVAERSARSSTPAIEFIGEDANDLVAAIRLRAGDAGVVAVIRNTVRRAQETAELLREEFPDHRVVLAHSRFVAQDRARIETELLNLFGADSTERPERAIVVGTQVLEQSLDVDFDLMFTDHAPTDLVLQRMGRLHRHDRPSRPAGVTRPTCVLIGTPELNSMDAGLNANPSRYVYPKYVLARSAQVIRRAAAEGTVDIPGDIPGLVNETYDVDHVDDSLRVYAEDWEKEKKEARAKAMGYRVSRPSWGRTIIGWLARTEKHADDDMQASRPSVRDTGDSLEVVVAQRCADGAIRTLSHLADGKGGLVVGSNGRPAERAARVLAATVIRLPVQASGSATREILENTRPESFTASVWLKRAVPLVLDDQLTAQVGDLTISYSTVAGLTVEKNK